MPEHILTALFDDDFAREIFKIYNVTPQKLKEIADGIDFFEECVGPDAQESIAKAITRKANALARTYKNAEVEPEHVLLAMIYGRSEYREGCPLTDFYLVEKITQDLETRLDLLSTGQALDAPPSESLKKLVMRAITLSSQCRIADRQVFPCGPIHFLVAVMEWEPKLLALDINKVRESMEHAHHPPYRVVKKSIASLNSFFKSVLNAFPERSRRSKYSR